MLVSENVDGVCIVKERGGSFLGVASSALWCGS